MYKDIITNSKVILEINFEPLFRMDFVKSGPYCILNSYKYFNPGPFEKKTCYRGLEKFYYQKYRHFKCKSFLEKLHKPEPGKCQCNSESFKWYFYHYFK